MSRSLKKGPFVEPRLLARIEAMNAAGEKGSDLATGGMITKLHAAEIATATGVEMVIYNGCYPECLYDIVEGKPVGTRFCVKGEKSC